MTIIVDSDGLIGSLNPSDIHYHRATRTLNKLIQKNSKLIYPVTVIVESVTFLQGRLNNPELAAEIIHLVDMNELDIEPIDVELLQKANIYMDFKRSKHNTLFDAIVVAVALKYNAEAIFSFDDFYKKKGFKLASQL